MSEISGSRVLILQPSASVEKHLLWFEEFDCRFTVRNQPLCGEEEKLLALCGGYDAVICPPHTKISRRMLEQGKRLQMIAVAGSAPSGIDLKAASEQGILVADAPLPAVSIAEHTIALMLALSKKLAAISAQHGEPASVSGSEIAHKTLGLLGVGRVGEEILQRMRGWEMRCIAYDPALSSERAAELGVTPVDREALFRQSDLLAVQPRCEEDTILIGERELEWMRPSALLAGALCGPAIDRMALTRALQQHKMGGAALDAWGDFPELIEMRDRVLLFSPTDSLTTEAEQQAADQATIHVIQALRGQAPSRLLNPEALPLWKRKFHPKTMEKRRRTDEE